MTDPAMTDPAMTDPARRPDSEDGPSAQRTATFAQTVGIAARVVTLAGMIATPLLPPRSKARQVLSTVVVTGLFASTASAAVDRWGVGRTVTAARTVVGATAAVERFGTATG
ncbi:MAG: hypothetical protein ACR2O6_13785, partial [Ilumatobacteraceae bacterium]